MKKTKVKSQPKRKLDKRAHHKAPFYMAIFASFLAIAFLFSIVFFPSLLTKASGQIIFTQTDWSGGADVSSATLPTDSTSWDKFTSSTNVIYEPNPLLDSGLKLTKDTNNIKWSTSDGTVISDAANIQNNSKIISDQGGGSIVAWEDDRDSVSSHIYAQRTDADGNRIWENGVGTLDYNGIPIFSTNTGTQTSFQMISDGSGGAIIVWQDDRNGIDDDIYAQKIDASGSLQWNHDGVSVVALAGEQYDPEIASDGSGGAIISWVDERNGNDNIYVQKIDASGVAKWLNNGVMISQDEAQDTSKIISDGSGGAIIAWDDYNNYATSGIDINAQKVDSSGHASWVGGVVITNSANDQNLRGIISDGSGGAIVTWEDYRDYATDDIDIYAQKINSAGQIKWTSDGLAVCVTQGTQTSPQLTSDGSGGAVITWSDDRNLATSGYDIYAQRVDNAGYIPWTANGVVVSSATRDQSSPQIISDGLNGAIISWEDYRSTTNSDIYAQNINSDGVDQWGNDGIAISAADQDQLTPQIVSDGSHGAIISWDDYRNGSNSDIYAQRAGPFIYINNGELVSSVIDAGQQTNWGKINWSTSSLSGVSVEFQTKTSVDNGSWSNWEDLDASNDIKSPAGQYIQYKADLITTDSLITPVLKIISISSIYNVPIVTLPPTYAPPSELPNQLEGNGNEKNETKSTEQKEQTKTPIFEPVPAELVMAGDSLETVQSSAIPEFYSTWGADYPLGRDTWALKHRANIYQAYLDILKRRPTTYEVNWWLTQSNDINLIRYDMLTSEEYKLKNQ